MCDKGSTSDVVKGPMPTDTPDPNLRDLLLRQRSSLNAGSPELSAREVLHRLSEKLQVGADQQIYRSNEDRETAINIRALLDALPSKLSPSAEMGLRTLISGFIQSINFR